ncbi:hypothetical protein MKK84_32875 [Methylobacterium sp. E-065]|uniref:hypothetical protein n=1 Tax=Methylobacterium sp. E-065 TaxID=2836583 RepID=UPI001FB9E018|nr:hypothetical protein [Methylobacterium sp. E-065]MCJ2022143.1 hypothetical protein [Methylobacterium sp. E-065]
MAADWISPKDRLPDEGQVVEISILAGSLDVSRAKRLGERWFVERDVGGPYQMCEPAMPAYWRPIARKQQAARAA